MNYKINLFLPLICLFLISCSSTPTELKVAEQIIESKPDSALKILQSIKPQSIKSDYNRALYGVLKAKALDNNYILLTSDSTLDFSIAYYQKTNNQQGLAASYFYKAKVYKNMQKYDKAIILYLKAMDYFIAHKENTYLGITYRDLGYICFIQKTKKEAREKLQLSIKYFKLAGRVNDVHSEIVNIGRTYNVEKSELKTAITYFRYVLRHTKDSVICGKTLLEIGTAYHNNRLQDSALLYLWKSLKYPTIGTYNSARYYTLADIDFDIAKYDSASYYAKMALSYPHNFYTQRECYRILTNMEYLRKDITQMNKYMEQYKSSSDSVRNIESQPKFKVLESLHYADLMAKKAKREMTLFVVILLISMLLSGLLVHALYKRNKQKKQQLSIVKDELNQKQQHVSQSLSKKIEDTKAYHIIKQKNYKTELVKLIYNNTLYLDNWQEFKFEMNHTFNQIIDKLEEEYPEITQRELIWCCLHLLEIPNSDRIYILDTTSDGLYKLKQRLSRKVKLKSTKELDEFLKKIITL